jgi:radical SAM superfamily enzyme YgiQ (UPF0313 family)
MKIALIAMSGIRALNPELTRLGMTLPGFVERSKVIASLPSLSLLTLAGMTPDDIEVSYHEIADIAALDHLPSCDLAAISTYSAQAKDAYALSRRFRSEGVPTVVGGLHATAIPHEAMEHFDAVVTGEGEISWPRVLDDFRSGRLQRLYEAGGRQFDLANAPTPRFDLLDPDKYNRIPVQTQRGCPWRCEFCASSILLSPHYMVKPVAKVLTEIRAIKKIWKRPFVEFADDNSFVNRKHSYELLRALADEGGVRWFSESDISIAEDDRLLALMREAGCAQILIGLESPGRPGLDGIEHRQNWKLKQLDRYKAAIERIQAHGIAVTGCFVLGLDGDTVDVFDAVREFAETSGLFQVQITVMTPFPGTPLYGRLQRDGRLLREGAWETCTLFDVNFVPKQMSVGDLEQRFMGLSKALYSATAKRNRNTAYRRQVRRSGHPLQQRTGG